MWGWEIERSRREGVREGRRMENAGKEARESRRNIVGRQGDGGGEGGKS